MKKFNIRKVLDGLKEASSSTSAPSVQVGPQENHLIQETIQSEHFQLCKTVRHGFPYQPSSMAFDPVQKILAIGTQTPRRSCEIVASKSKNSLCRNSTAGSRIASENARRRAGIRLLLQVPLVFSCLSNSLRQLIMA
ncbi:Syntaxin-binding protein 5 [Takifugu flavidus]|uniref:Syntaxin-binding protein 5 n=1 Tax=Takifugu flavidus TaxID=433684 RepID=A0A5C6NQH9_9TELE|nr:Syntaxin-binding protein 5 [Takifugu flavidus]